MALCTLRVHISLTSIPDLVSCQPKKASKVKKIPCESLKIEFRTTGLEASPAVGVTGPQGVKLFLQG